MKPRLYFKWHVWCCATIVNGRRIRLGYGYTPADAYKDWEAQQ